MNFRPLFWNTSTVTQLLTWPSAPCQFFRLPSFNSNTSTIALSIPGQECEFLVSLWNTTTVTQLLLSSPTLNCSIPIPILPPSYLWFQDRGWVNLVTFSNTSTAIQLLASPRQIFNSNSTNNQLSEALIAQLEVQLFPHRTSVLGRRCELVWFFQTQLPWFNFSFSLQLLNSIPSTFKYNLNSIPPIPQLQTQLVNSPPISYPCFLDRDVNYSNSPFQNTTTVTQLLFLFFAAPPLNTFGSSNTTSTGYLQLFNSNLNSLTALLYCTFDSWTGWWISLILPFITTTVSQLLISSSPQLLN